MLLVVIKDNKTRTKSEIMKKTILFIIFTFSFLNLSLACKCMETTIEQSVERNDLSFSGEVIKIEIVEKISGIRQDKKGVKVKGKYYSENKRLYQQTTVVVKTVYKGNPESDTIYVLSSRFSAGSCGVSFTEGDVFIINASKWSSTILQVDQKGKWRTEEISDPTIYSTSICQLTQVFNTETETKILTYLKESKPNLK